MSLGTLQKLLTFLCIIAPDWGTSPCLGSRREREENFAHCTIHKERWDHRITLNGHLLFYVCAVATLTGNYADDFDDDEDDFASDCDNDADEISEDEAAADESDPLSDSIEEVIPVSMSAFLFGWQ